MKGKKGKILYVGGFELPDKNAAAHRVLSNAKAFSQLGYSVSFVGVTKEEQTSSTPIQYNGFDCYAEKYPNTHREWITYISDISFLKSLIEFKDADIIIAYNYPAIKLLKLLFYCKKHNKKLVGDCTEWYMSVQENLIRRVIKTLDTVFRMRFLHERLDGLIVISSYLENFYARKMINVLNLPPLVDKKEKKWEIKNKTSKELSLIYAGSPSRGNKDRLDYIIENLNKISKKINRKFSLSIVGMTKEEYINVFAPLDKELSSNFKLEFNGRLTHIQAINQIKKCDFQIFLREENLANQAGFPTKFVESTTAGVLIITNATSDLSKYKGLEHVFLVDINKIETDLYYILNLELDQLRSIKHQINRELFDYRQYTSRIKTFIDNLMS